MKVEEEGKKKKKKKEEEEEEEGAAKRGNRKQRNEEVAKEERDYEDWCFECKDGGDLILCDYPNCLKVYHPGCVGRDESRVAAEEHWTCGRHSCLLCQKPPRFYCYCCPAAVCGRCISSTEFAPIRGKKGLCNNCLGLVLFAEKDGDVYIEGDDIDLQDRNTYECLFVEYWDIIKEEESLTLDDVYSADVKLQKGRSSKYSSQAYKVGDEDIVSITSSSSQSDSEESETMGKKKGSKELEFIGWGSKPLIQFLRSLGRDTSRELSQYEIDSIISSYIRERKLYDPKNKKRVVCDESLYWIFRRKSLHKNKIYGLLEAHLVMNLDISEDDENEDEHTSNSHDTDDKTMSTSKKRRLVCSEERSQKIERDSNVQASCFASIVAENIKLIYLRRSLVEELQKETDNFSVKVEGSFVKVKIGRRDFIRKNSHQLLQVTGVKQTSTTGENKSETVLSLFNTATEVSISMLSDSDLCEEEIEDLRQNVEEGLFPKLTVMELEQKARSLHEDITKHWIKTEMARLQNCIDFANEKGWRREMYEYMEQRQLLKKPSEQERLLQQLPKVIAEASRGKTD